MNGSVIEKIQKHRLLLIRSRDIPEKVMKDSEDVQRLIRLKRYETPGDEYFESFLEQFKERQRSEMLHRSARGLLLERAQVWFDELHGAKWLAPMGAAAALAAGVFFLVAPSSENSAQPAQLALEEPAALFLTPQQRADEEQVISVQLPHISQRVPAWNNPSAERQRLLPVGAKGAFREF